MYRARQRAFSRTVAVKVLCGADRDSEALKRFDRERPAIGAVSGHPNIVTVYESGLTMAAVPFIAMEFLARGSLADLVDRAGMLTWKPVVQVGVKLASALESARRLGILHRDIKPENVLLSSFGEPKLADFGIAHILGGEGTWSSSGVQLSIAHAPPEIVDAQPATEASDVFSLASTLFTLASGRPQFVDAHDHSLVHLLIRIAKAPLPDLTERGAPRRRQRGRRVQRREEPLLSLPELDGRVARRRVRPKRCVRPVRERGVPRSRVSRPRSDGRHPLRHFETDRSSTGERTRLVVAARAGYC